MYGITTDNENLMATATEVMTSRSLAGEVADSLGLRLKVDEPRRTPRSSIIAWAHVDSGAARRSYRLVPAARGQVQVRDLSNRALGTFASNSVIASLARSSVGVSPAARSIKVAPICRSRRRSARSRMVRA